MDITSMHLHNNVYQAISNISSNGKEPKLPTCCPKKTGKKNISVPWPVKNRLHEKTRKLSNIGKKPEAEQTCQEPRKGDHLRLLHDVAQGVLQRSSQRRVLQISLASNRRRLYWRLFLLKAIDIGLMATKSKPCNMYFPLGKAVHSSCVEGQPAWRQLKQ